MNVLAVPPGLWGAAAWAGLLALDITACGPWMVWQPMVCGPLYGLLLHRVWAGVVIGGVVQLIWMDVTPVGVGIPYDVTAVTLLAVYWAGATSATPTSVVLALALAVPFGFLFRAVDFFSRRLNTWMVRRIEGVPDPYLTLALTGGTLAGVLWTWVRYTLLYALFMGAGQRLWAMAGTISATSWMARGLDAVLVLLPMAGFGVVLELFLSEEPERHAFPRRAKGPS